jgi:hypothetical protein
VAVSSVPAVESAIVDDPRLLAWRELVASAAVQALQTYRGVWSAPGEDEVRVLAGVGVLDDPAPTAATATALGLPAEGPFAELVTAAHLTLGDEAVLAAAWWSAADPQLAVAFGAVHDDGTRRHVTLGMLAHLLATHGIRVPLVVGTTHPLVSGGLLPPVDGPDVAVVLPLGTAELLAGQVAPRSSVSAVAPRLAPVVGTVAALVADGLSVLVRTDADDDRPLLRDAVAARLGIGIPGESRSPALAQLLFRLRRELPAVVLAPGGEVPDGVRLVLGPPETVAPAGWHVIDVPGPSAVAAVRLWRKALRTSDIQATNDEIVTLAGRLTLGEGAVDEVVRRAVTVAAAERRPAATADVAEALRHYPQHDPGGLARRLVATTTLEQLVLPASTRRSLDEVVAHARFSGSAQERLGFEGVRGRAVIALFHGPSGTGKTAAAEALANAVDRELWVVDLAKVVSKWLGETQRNLDAVLATAARAGVVLLFDEADGLFGKRGEVTDARDRYANLEIDHLLQRVEVHEGVVVLTSNRPAALDEAFARRIRLSVRFDLPDHADREELWRRFLPADLLSDGTDAHTVAREALSGAAIRAAALAATVMAMADGTAVTGRHLDGAVRRELEKTRRPPTARGAIP